VRLNCGTRHHAVDIAMLMCVAGLAVATWAAMSHAGRVSAWQPCFGISATIFLALAALTPQMQWAATVRLAMSGWIILAPWLLAFADLPLARWSHLIVGTLIATLSAPYLLYRATLMGSDDASCA
jgi:hypothetical protein